ncbi:MAG: tyrosine-type recombinase/integrase [Solirubrobacteraceae bacterium]
MSALAPTLQTWFTERLINQRQVSPHTIAAYRDTLRLLITFAAQRHGTQPCQLDIGDLDAPTIGAFLDHLENERGNSARTRNARLAAIHSLFRYASHRHPEHAQDIQRVLAIPAKRTERAIVTFLDPQEIDVLLAAPDRLTWTGRRDHALLALAIQTGLRASELTGLTCADVHLATGAHVSCRGKGRKTRITPLTTTTTAVLRVWLQERAGQPEDPLFPTIRGGRLTHDGLERRIAKYVGIAAERHPTLSAKTVTMHTMRHTAAMQLLHAGVDTTVIALWLGHERVETTQIYLHADLQLKEKALARTTPPDTTPGRYRPPDRLLGFLESL